MRWVALAVVCTGLTGCSASLFTLPKLPERAPSSPAVSPVAVRAACPAEMTLDLDEKPSVPVGAYIPKPPAADEQAKAGWDVFLTYLGNDYAGWANEGWRRAAVARDWALSHCTQ